MYFRVFSKFLVGSLIVTAGVVSCTGDDDIVDWTGKQDPSQTDATTSYQCMSVAKPGINDTVALEPVFSDLRLTNATQMVQVPGDPEHFWISDRTVGLFRFDPNAPGDSQTLVLNLRDIGNDTKLGKILANEIYSFVLHPRFPEQPYLYLYYVGFVADNPVFPFGRRVLVSRFTWDGAKFEVGSEQNYFGLAGPSNDPDHLFEVADHPGSILGFDANENLLLAVGDLGIFPSSPELRDLNPSQDMTSLGGKILRIGVNSGSSYTIPTDNPHFGSTCELGACPEIYASGLRHPWRGSIDAETGQIWLGDVGWSTFEEINRIEAGKDYGWPTIEGSRCTVDDQHCADAIASGKLTPPSLLLGRDRAQSVVGGFIYRGQNLPNLRGKYVFSDWILGTIQSFDPENPSATHTTVGHTNYSIASLARGLDGELFALHLLLPTGSEVLRLVPREKSQVSLPSVPKKLSETGCFEPGNPRQPLSTLVPYDVNAPLWSDGAGKDRWFYLPEGEKITVDQQTGKFLFPVGSVLVKRFSIGDRIAEVRFFVRHDEDTWQGYTYEWNENENDATLLDIGRVRDVNGQAWSFPSRSECAGCHTRAVDSVLGLELRQLDMTNMSAFYGGDNQLQQLRSLEYFANDLPELKAYPRFDDEGADLARRARGYLHSNCSGCHQPGGSTPTDIDFRFDTPLAEMRLCDVDPTDSLQIDDAKRVAPGAPQRSVVLSRMRHTGMLRMPPMATRVVDDQGSALVERWIRGLESCE